METIYCGPAPVPANLLAAWNLDLVAIAVAAGVVLAHLVTRRDGRGPLLLGVAVFCLLFLSPLCALTTALFSVRAVHHVVLVAIAAPLLALAFGAAVSRHRPPLSVGGALALSTVAMWVWHIPSFYAAGIGSAPLYWLMQASLLGSGIFFWWAVLTPAARPGGALLGLLGAVVQMGMLGALLTFAARPLYEAHALTTTPFGLSPLEDQQLAGLVLWVPAAAPYVIAALILVLRLQPPGNPVRPRPVADA